MHYSDSHNLKRKNASIYLWKANPFCNLRCTKVLPSTHRSEDVSVYFCTSVPELTFCHQIQAWYEHMFICPLLFRTPFSVAKLERFFEPQSSTWLFDVTDVRIGVGGLDWCWALSTVLWLRLELQLLWRKSPCWLLTDVLCVYVCACACVSIWAWAPIYAWRVCVQMCLY